MDTTKRTVIVICSVRGQERREEIRLAVEIPAGVRDIEAFRSPMLYEEAVRMRCVSELGLAAEDVVCYSLRLERPERAPRRAVAVAENGKIENGKMGRPGGSMAMLREAARPFYKSAADWLNAPADADADMNSEGEAVLA